MVSYDLTPKLGRYLDRHLIFPLLEFASVKAIYQPRQVLLTKFNLLKSTNMVDFSLDVHNELHPNSESSELVKKREEVVSTLKQLTQQTNEILGIILEENVRKEIEASRDTKQLLEKLDKDFNVKPEMIESLYKLAKFQYECGNYSGASHLLSTYAVLILPSDKNYLPALWGKLASEILMQHWDLALKDLQRLKDYLDNNFSNHLHAAQQRTWLIHWSLFVFFNHVEGREMLIEMFLEKKSSYYNPKNQHQPYLNAIQTMCPHILRYLTAAVITSRQRRVYMKELVKVIQQESYTYRDPITEFVECLYVNFDFDGAQQKLRECETVLSHDFFLVACQADFIDNARLFIFETFCQIHECISIHNLADKLNMNPEEAERWIVNLIRNARLDAKIDSKLGHVVMGTQAISPYQQLIEKTKAMTIRCHILSVNIEKKLQSQSQENDNAFGTRNFGDY